MARHHPPQVAGLGLPQDDEAGVAAGRRGDAAERLLDRPHRREGPAAEGGLQPVEQVGHLGAGPAGGVVLSRPVPPW